MTIEATLKAMARSIARLPGVSRLLRIPAVRRSLAGLPGAGRLLSGNAEAARWDRPHPFDAAYGTDTSGFVAVAQLDQVASEAARAHALPYGGSQPSILRTALAALPPLETFAFVDLGCGKGRPLLVASEFPFRDIVGVELSAPLAEIARQNAALVAVRFPQRTPIRVTVEDAGRFALPSGNLVLFLYNPFDDAVIADVARAVNAAIAAEPRHLYVVYYNPVAGHCFDASPLLRRHFAATLPYAPDELGYGPDAEDPVVIWQGGMATAQPGFRADDRIEVVDVRHRVKLIPVEPAGR